MPGQLFIQVLVERNVAGQQGQRVGIAGIANLLIGDALQQCAGLGDAVVALIRGDDKIQRHAVFGAVGQQTAYRFQGGVVADHNRVRVHELANRLAPVKFPGIALGEQLQYFRAVHHAHRRSVIDDRQAGHQAVVEKNFHYLVERSKRRH